MTTEHSASTPHDFDFLFGTWHVRHRRLQARLAGCKAWDEFDGRCEARAVLGGAGIMDDNVLELPGGAYRALTLRTFDPRASTWSIWWLDARTPGRLDPPVVGEFVEGVGQFYGDDLFEGRPIRVRFLWTGITPYSCRWEQAFSIDGGASWENNWTMRFTRAE